MDSFIKNQLEQIEQAARQIVSSIRGIIGYCNGQETVANNLMREQEEKEKQNLLIENK